MAQHFADDLSRHRPGQAAREHANELRELAPFKTFVARILNLHTDERAWRIGAAGESQTARQLFKLHDSWRVLHSIPVGSHGSDIDHVVIGPGGVFTINTKHHSNANIWVGGDSFVVNGTRHPYLRNAEFESWRAQHLLGAACGSAVGVRSIIAVVGARRLTLQSQPDHGVTVLGHRSLSTWLRSQTPILDSAMIAHIYDKARWSSTWAS